MNKKASIIQMAVDRNDVDSIKYLAKTEFGLVNKELRKKCWSVKRAMTQKLFVHLECLFTTLGKLTIR